MNNRAQKTKNSAIIGFSVPVPCQLSRMPKIKIKMEKQLFPGWKFDRTLPCDELAC